MRTIQFRAKREDNKEWVIDNSVLFFQTTTKIYGKLNHWQEIEVITETVSQYTGLHDKNGKEIYEGDIVKTKYIEKRDFQGVKYNNEMEFVELVVFKDQAFQLEINNGGIKMYRLLNLGKDARTYGNIELKEIEVIGNVYDNGDLYLKNGKT